MKINSTFKKVAGFIATVFLGNQMFNLLFGFYPIPSMLIDGSNSAGQWIVGVVALVLFCIISIGEFITEGEEPK